MVSDSMDGVNWGVDSVDSVDRGMDSMDRGVDSVDSVDRGSSVSTSSGRGVLGLSGVSHLSNVAVVVVGVVGDMLGAAVRKVDRVRSSDNTSSIVGFRLLEVSLRVVVSDGVLVGVGGGLGQVGGSVASRGLSVLGS